MKNLLLILLFILSFSLFSFEKSETYSLTVNVSNLRNSDGVVLVLLYDKDGTIPDKQRSKYLIKRTINIEAGEASITFTNLPSKTYAVNIIHDENNNGVIDMGFMFPKEGVGFTNFEKLNLMNRPNFSKASFELKSNMTLSVKTIYM
jgi:uncharacterized protein (DUF2141 family)